MTNEVQIINENQIKNMVYEVRGQQVMLDFELAEIYGYETRAFNQQIKRNIEKFDDDFMFQLTREELESVKSQIVTSPDNLFSGQDGGRRKLPYAFTEQGIYMLMTVLKGELAIKQSKALIRLFKRMKDYILENQYIVGPNDFYHLSHRVDLLSEENKMIREEMKNFATKDDINKIETELNAMMDNFIDESKYKHFLIMNGEKIEADIAYTNIYKLAKHSLYIVDNYISLKTLELLRSVNKEVDVILFSDNIHHNNKLTNNIYEDFKNEYSEINISLKTTDRKYHDRYIVIDYNTSEEKVYYCGSSSKDSGNKITTISKVEDTSIYHTIINDLLNNPELTL